jgi:hypothetical protein
MPEAPPGGGEWCGCREGIGGVGTCYDHDFAWGVCAVGGRHIEGDVQVDPRW